MMKTYGCFRRRMFYQGGYHDHNWLPYEFDDLYAIHHLQHTYSIYDSTSTLLKEIIMIFDVVRHTLCATRFFYWNIEILAEAGCAYFPNHSRSQMFLLTFSII